MQWIWDLPRAIVYIAGTLFGVGKMVCHIFGCAPDLVFLKLVFPDPWPKGPRASSEVTQQSCLFVYFSKTSVFGQPPLFSKVYWCLLIAVHCLMMVLGLCIAICMFCVILVTFQTLFPLLILGMGSDAGMHRWMLNRRVDPRPHSQRKKQQLCNTKCFCFSPIFSKKTAKNKKAKHPNGQSAGHRPNAFWPTLIYALG